MEEALRRWAQQACYGTRTAHSRQLGPLLRCSTPQDSGSCSCCCCAAVSDDDLVLLQTQVPPTPRALSWRRCELQQRCTGGQQPRLAAVVVTLSQQWFPCVWRRATAMTPGRTVAAPSAVFVQQQGHSRARLLFGLAPGWKQSQPCGHLEQQSQAVELPCGRWPSGCALSPFCCFRPVLTALMCLRVFGCSVPPAPASQWH